MELVYVTVIGAILGGAARYLLPGRHHYGLLLLPAIGAAATSAVWVGLVWAGLKFDGGWIWIASLGAAVIASVLTGLLLVRSRIEGDAKMLHHLSGGRA
ncbi:hypothetical protein BH09ACT4_BH09ACT4_01130 [soil metagenome]